MKTRLSTSSPASAASNERRKVSAKGIENDVRRKLNNRYYGAPAHGDIRFTEVKRGIDKKSGAVITRHDEVFHGGLLVGRIQYRSIGVNQDVITISTGGGAREGKKVNWLVNKAKANLMFLKDSDKREAFEFNNQRKGAPKSK